MDKTRKYVYYKLMSSYAISSTGSIPQGLYLRPHWSLICNSFLHAEVAVPSSNSVTVHLVYVPQYTCHPQNLNTNTSTNSNYWKQFNICTAVLLVLRPYPSWDAVKITLLKSLTIISVYVVMSQTQYADRFVVLCSIFRYCFLLLQFISI